MNMRTATNQETGQRYVYDEGLGLWQERDPQEVAALESEDKKGTLEWMIDSAIAGAQDTLGLAQEVAGGGGGVIGGAIFDPTMLATNLMRSRLGGGETGVAAVGREMQEANDPAQAARSELNPLGEFAASTVLDPTNFIPGGMIAKAARGRVARPRNTPLERTVDSAQTVVDEARVARGEAASGPWGGVPDTPPPGVQRPGAELRTGGVTAGPGGAGADDIMGGYRFRRMEENVFNDADPKVASVRMADELGIPLTRGMRRGSKSQQTVEEGLTRNPGAMEVYNREIVQPTEEIVVNNAREAFGIGPGNKLDRLDFERGSDAIMAEYQDIVEQIPGKHLVTGDDVTQMKNLIAGATSDMTAQKKIYDRYVKAFDRNADGDRTHPMDDVLFNNARMDAKDMWSKVRELDQAIMDAGTGSEREALQNLRDFWMERMLGMAGDQSATVQARIKNVNEKFRVKKLLERNNVMDGDGIRPRSLAYGARQVFGDAMRRTDFKDGKGRDFEGATTNLLKTLQVIGDFPQVLGNSGTPTGMMLSGGLQNATANILKGRIGAEAYFGKPLGAAKAAALTPAGKLAGVTAATAAGINLGPD